MRPNDSLKRALTASLFAALLAVTAVRIFCGEHLTPLDKPLPFFAYPFLALTLVGCAWMHIRSHPASDTRS